MSNSVLPVGISPHFQDVFIPTLLAYCGTIPNPWDLPRPLEDIIAELWLVVFPQTLPYNAQPSGLRAFALWVASAFQYLLITNP